jgi:acetyl-CoA synthetase
VETLLTVDEAAERLKVDGETIRRWLRSGQLHGMKYGRVWRIPESALLHPTSTPVPATVAQLSPTLQNSNSV